MGFVFRGTGALYVLRGQQHQPVVLPVSHVSALNESVLES